MDPTALAAAATALLAPYVAKAGEKLAEKVGEKLPEQMGKLWTAIAAKFKGKPAAEEAAKDLAANPKDEDNQAAFRKELKKLLAEDGGFVNELEQLLKSAQAATSITASQGGAVVMGDGTAIGIEGNLSGNIVFGNNNTAANEIRQGGSGDVTGGDKTSG
jgi:hypothetical protein